MKPLLSIGALFLAVGTSPLLAQAEKQWDPNLIGLAPALKEAGFDRNDPESLMVAARHEGSLDSPLVRQGAAYGLGMFTLHPGSSANFCAWWTIQARVSPLWPANLWRSGMTEVG